jgi:hypothetical protein
MGESAWILGIWLFSGLLYNGQPHPLPNPNLRICFEFAANGKNTLFYDRIDESGFCHREAIWSLVNGQLRQKVVWVNPKNNGTCAQDTDMRLGSYSESQVLSHDGRLILDVMVGEETIQYVFRKVEMEDVEPTPLPNADNLSQGIDVRHTGCIKTLQSVGPKLAK